jgi:trafficking protein particle complex subunit 5
MRWLCFIKPPGLCYISLSCGTQIDSNVSCESQQETTMSRSVNNTAATSILDRPLGRINVGSGPRSLMSGGNAASDTQPTTVVSLSMFAYMFSEMVQYYQNRVDSISELERRLENSGYSVGLRVLELLAIRGTGSSITRGGLTNDYRRETKLMNILQFISTTVWKSLFHKAADSLERSIDHADEYMIVDYAPITR